MFARLAAFFTNTLDTFIAAQQMRALASLTDRQLRDIGLTDDLARAESARGLFDLPKGR